MQKKAENEICIDQEADSDKSFFIYQGLELPYMALVHT